MRKEYEMHVLVIITCCVSLAFTTFAESSNTVSGASVITKRDYDTAIRKNALLIQQCRRLTAENAALKDKLTALTLNPTAPQSPGTTRLVAGLTNTIVYLQKANANLRNGKSLRLAANAGRGDKAAKAQLDELQKDRENEARVISLALGNPSPNAQFQQGFAQQNLNIRPIRSATPVIIQTPGLSGTGSQEISDLEDTVAAKDYELEETRRRAAEAEAERQRLEYKLRQQQQDEEWQRQIRFSRDGQTF